MRSLFVTFVAAAFSATTSTVYRGTPLDTRDTLWSDPVEPDVTSRPDVKAETSRSASSLWRWQGTVFKPINPAIFESAAGIGARDATEFDHLSPATQAQMVFGSPGSHGQLHLANMTLYAADGLPIVMMERFEALTASVDCEGDDGRLSLTFSSQEAYDKATSTWSYINEATELQFLMITNHDGCGPDEERQAYKITNVDNNQSSLTAYLAATPAAWKEIAGSFDLDFGKATTTISARQVIRARGWFDWVDDAVDTVKDTFNDAVDAIQEVGDSEISQSVNIPVSAGQEGVETLLFKDVTTNPPQLKLYCDSCFVEGSFQTKGSLRVENFIPESMLLEVLPQDFRAALELKAEVAKTNPDVDGLTWEKTLFEAVIPGAGIVIPKILTLGAKFEFKIQGKASVTGRATITVGARTSLPNGARVAIDMVHYENSDISGFGAIDFDPIFDLDQASITADLAAGPRPALVLGVEVLDDTGIEAALTFGTPTFNINATAGYDEKGFCSNSTATSGVKVVSGASFDMSLSIQGKVDDDVHTFFDRKLVNIPLPPFVGKCWDIEPPDVQPPDVKPTDVYYRYDCNTTTNGTGADLVPRAPGCTRVPVLKFSCKEYPNACKNMCFNRYCKGGTGAYPELLHRGATGSSDWRRSQGGYLAPSRSRQPCNPSNARRVPRLFNEVRSSTSMDEFAMALMVEGGRHGSWGPGFRCINRRENSGAGSKVEALLNQAKVPNSDTPSNNNTFDIEFIDTDAVNEDYCDTDENGRPLSQCKNDGYQFIAKWTGQNNVFEYVWVNDGQGWTGTSNSKPRRFR